MREDLERLGEQVARDARASEYLRGFQWGVAMRALPKDVSADMQLGYNVGRQACKYGVNEWLVDQKLQPLGFGECLNLLMRLHD
jgi:hypothetical protein